jgi:hypothetical protein
MSSRHQPLNGADSGEYVLRRFRVTMADDDLDGFGFDVRITAALGPADARNQARDRYPTCGVLKVEEVAA